VKQEAPDPDILFDLVKRVSYRPGWTIRLVDMQRDDDHGRGTAGGLTLVIRTWGYDSYHPEVYAQDPDSPYTVRHFFIVPAATYNERSWKRWLYERFCEVERHEAAEFFALDADPDKPGSGKRPFAPNHQPGADPYTFYELGTVEDADTTFLGKRAHPDSTLPGRG